MSRKCKCANEFDVRLCRSYEEFKRVLNIGRHPTFIGRQTFESCKRNGGAMMYQYQNESVAVSLINPHYGILLVLNVHPNHRSHGLGRAIMNFLIPNFARVIETKIKWFESCGYIGIGELKQGLRYKTQIMARKELFTLAGRIKNLALKEE